MAQFVNIFDVDLVNRHNDPQPLRAMVGEGDVNGLRVGARVTSDGQSVALNGNCVGKVVRADGATVQLTGTIEGNLAYVVLDQQCCAIEGPIQVAVCWVSGSNVTTLVVAYGDVVNTQTGNAIQPGTPIPDLTQLLAEIDAMRTATAAANAAAASALGNFAGSFSASTAYSAGQYVTYSDGKFYKFVADHPAGAWDASHVRQVRTGTELHTINNLLDVLESDSIIKRGWLADNTDLDTILTPGMYWKSNTISVSHAPEEAGNAYNLVVVNTGDIYQTCQIILPYGSGNMFYRFYSNQTTFGNWIKLPNYDDAIAKRGTLADNTDLDTILTPGMYWKNNSISVSHAPEEAGNAYNLVVVNSGNYHQTCQIILPYGSGHMFYRFYSGLTTFGNWIKLPNYADIFPSSGALEDNDDLDTIHAPGVYWKGNAVTVLNAPEDIGHAFNLIVIKPGNNDYKTVQIILPYGSGNIYYRYYSDMTTLSSWQKIPNFSDLENLEELEGVLEDIEELQNAVNDIASHLVAYAIVDKSSDVFIASSQHGMLSYTDGHLIEDAKYNILTYTFDADGTVQLAADGTGVVGCVLYSETLDTISTSSAETQQYYVNGARTDASGYPLPSIESPWTVSAGQMIAICIEDNEYPALDFSFEYPYVPTIDVGPISGETKRPIIRYLSSPDTGIDSTGKEQISIFLPATTGYIKYAFVRIEKNSINADIWKIERCFACDDNLRVLFPITNAGEWEMAIKINDAPDHIGGNAHGDEVLTSFYVLIDGVRISDITQITRQEFNTVNIIETSLMYDPSDGATLSTRSQYTPVGTHSHEYVIDRNGIRLIQNVVLDTALDLGSSYMTMLPIIRGNDEVSTLQVTDHYYANNNYIPHDVSVSGSGDGYGFQKNVTRVKIWGETSGVSAVVEMVKQPDVNNTGARMFQVKDNALYNKLYWSICGADNTIYSASANERFETDTLYKIDRK